MVENSRMAEGGVENVGVDFAGRVQSGLVWREWVETRAGTGRGQNWRRGE